MAQPGEQDKIGKLIAQEIENREEMECKQKDKGSVPEERMNMHEIHVYDTKIVAFAPVYHESNRLVKASQAIPLYPGFSLYEFNDNHQLKHSDPIKSLSLPQRYYDAITKYYKEHPGYKGAIEFKRT